MRVVVLTPGKKNHFEIASYSMQLIECLRQLISDKPDSCIDEIPVVKVPVGVNAADCECIIKDDLSTYYGAAQRINQHYDVCILQHHKDLYAGVDGNYILALTSELKVPLITTFHEVSSDPSDREKRLFKALSAASEKVLSFSALSIEFMEHYYKLNRAHVARTEHAIPVFRRISSDELSSSLGFIETKRIILSAGNINGTGGYSTIINALPSLVSHYPNLVYVVINTGIEPDKNNEKALERLAHQRGVRSNVLFLNQHELKVELESVLQACEVFISASIDDKELDNSMLAKAVSCGAAVLSTPTWFAKELLVDQKGQFYAFKGANELSYELLSLLRNQKERQMFHDNAALYGEQNTWTIVGSRLLDLMKATMVNSKRTVSQLSIVKPSLLPDLNLSHLANLTDRTGVLPQSVYGILDHNTGYALKDNAMALHCYTYAYNHTKDQHWQKGINTCLAFISSMFDEDQGWSSKMTYGHNKNHQVDEISEARTIWGLGYLYASTCCNGIKDYTYSLISKMLRSDYVDIKAKAYAALGIVQVLKCDRANAEMSNLLEIWSKEMYQSFPVDPYAKWQWNEGKVRNEMALVPLSLATSADLLNNKNYLSTAKRALRFLQKIVFSERVYAPSAIGLTEANQSIDTKCARYASEAYLMTLAYSTLYLITKEPKYLKTINEVHNWYLGDNSINKPLYDAAGGGCYAYISGRSVSPEQTAESTCAYWLSHFALLETYFEEIGVNS